MPLFTSPSWARIECPLFANYSCHFQLISFSQQYFPVYKKLWSQLCLKCHKGPEILFTRQRRTFISFWEAERCERKEVAGKAICLQAQQSRASTFTSHPVSPSPQAHLPVGNCADLNNVPGGNSQKRGNNRSISMSLLFPAFNFQEYFC